MLFLTCMYKEKRLTYLIPEILFNQAESVLVILSGATHTDHWKSS